MDRDSIAKKIIEMVCEKAGETPAELDEDALIIEDIGLSSIEMLFVVNDAENEFSIKLEENEMREIFSLGDFIDLVEAKVNAQQ